MWLIEANASKSWCEEKQDIKCYAAVTANVNTAGCQDIKIAQLK